MAHKIVEIAIDIMKRDQLLQNMTTDSATLRILYKLEQGDGIMLDDLLRVMANYPAHCVRNGLRFLEQLERGELDRSWTPDQVMNKMQVKSRIVALFIADATEVL